MQNTKSYEDLKAELGNSGDWGEITVVSTGQAADTTLWELRKFQKRQVGPGLPFPRGPPTPTGSEKCFSLLNFKASSCFFCSMCSSEHA